MRLAAALVALAIINACTGWRSFREELRLYKSQNVSEMVVRLGAPNRALDLPGSPERVAYTWSIRNRGGDHVCDVTAIADKRSGLVESVTDNCPNDR